MISHLKKDFLAKFRKDLILSFNLGEFENFLSKHDRKILAYMLNEKSKYELKLFDKRFSKYENILLRINIIRYLGLKKAIYFFKS